jgi:hypothetical protein
MTLMVVGMHSNKRLLLSAEGLWLARRARDWHLEPQQKRKHVRRYENGRYVDRLAGDLLQPE